MYKLWKYYNQNRIKVWSIILAIILGFALIKTLNINLKNKKVEDKETTSNVVSYNNESKSMVNGGSVSNKYSEDLGKFINQFFTSLLIYSSSHFFIFLLFSFIIQKFLLCNCILSFIC